MTRVKTILAAGTTATAAVALAAVLLEGALRRFYPPPPRFSSVFAYRVPDPVLGWRLAPDTRITNDTGEFSVTVETNSQGLRDHEHAEAKPPGTFRVLVLGDSFMEAYSVALEDSFARRLERVLAGRAAPGGLKVEVINLGVGGYGTYQEYLSFKTLGAKYGPDLVLLGFHTASDVTDNDWELDSQLQEPGSLKGQSRPFIRPGKGGGWEVRPPEYDRSVAAYERSRATLAAQPRWWEAAATLRAGPGSPPRWWEKTVIAYLAASASRRSGGLDGTVPDPRLRRVWLQVHACRELPAFTRGWTITEAILDHLNEQVAKSGARLVVFSVPARHEVDPASWRRLLDAGANAGDYCFDSLPGNRRLESILQRAGIPFVDLVPAFRAELAAGGRPLHRAADLHWNEAGHRVAAVAVAESLAERGLLAAPEPRPAAARRSSR